jgi:protein-tyrosine phosphatase
MHRTLTNNDDLCIVHLSSDVLSTLTVAAHSVANDDDDGDGDNSAAAAAANSKAKSKRKRERAATESKGKDAKGDDKDMKHGSLGRSSSVLTSHLLSQLVDDAQAVGASDLARSAAALESSASSSSTAPSSSVKKRRRRDSASPAVASPSAPAIGAFDALGDGSDASLWQEIFNIQMSPRKPSPTVKALSLASASLDMASLSQSVASTTTAAADTASSSSSSGGSKSSRSSKHRGVRKTVSARFSRAEVSSAKHVPMTPTLSLAPLNIGSISSRGASSTSGGKSKKKGSVVRFDDASKTADSDSLERMRKFNGSGGQSMKDRLAFFDKDCSLVEERLFLGSETVSKDKALLKQNGVTHILNCAGTICLESHPDDFVYKWLSLVDGKAEDIGCLLYDVIEWLDEVLSANDTNRVFIHCQQGVSRSSSMCIAYMMWKYDRSYQESHLAVKKMRDVSNPNPNFQCQLQLMYNAWHRPFKAPRLYMIKPHTQYSPELIVAKQVEPALGADSLDPRTAFIVRSSEAAFCWLGAKCIGELEQGALRWLKRFERFERIEAANVHVVRQGNEPELFWQTLPGADGKPTEQPAIAECDVYAHTFDVVLPMMLAGTSLREEFRREMREQLLAAGSDPTRDGIGRSAYSSVDPSVSTVADADTSGSESNADSSKPSASSSSSSATATLHQRPKWESLDGFDFDDLTDDQVFVLVVHDKNATRSKVYVWIGDDVGNCSDGKAKKLARACIAKNNFDSSNLRIQVVRQDEEPKEFWRFFE